MEPGFALEQHFTSVHTLEEMGESAQQRMLGSELDLNIFQHSTVENQVALIVKHLYDNKQLRQKFGLQGSVSFENYANTLSPESQLEQDIEQMTIRQRRSPRLRAKERVKEIIKERTEIEDAACKITAGSSHPRAD
ncbi:hypothetical protein GQ44DRAFT_753203 [Phaeosphaeriaceae sp. PMI808]|nr:hypothetical protein GQ44DRAFT_753203 [Phaeosphaeriaceae sp. PMI808]